MEPNATVYAEGRPVHGVSLRDQPWDEAQGIIREAWHAGYRAMDFDDALLMFKPDMDDVEAMWRNGLAQTYVTESVEEALKLAAEVWWPEEER